MKYPDTYTIHLGKDYHVELNKLDIGDGFCIYSFDLCGECEWNRVAAKELRERLKAYDFDTIMTVQTKSCGLAQAMSEDYPRYLELRKARKPFMVEPQGVSVQSITTHGKQELWIGKEKYQHFIGKRVCFLDDVVSTGGTIDAVMEMAPKIGVEIAVIACVLTEGTPRTEYKGIPLVALDHLPLPGKEE